MTLVKFVALLATITLPVAIVLSNVQYLAYNQSVYFDIYSKHSIYNSFETQQIAQDATRNLMSFFKGSSNLDEKFYSNQAVLHLHDVKSYIKIVSNLNLVLTILLLLYFSFLGSKRQLKQIANIITRSSLVTITLVLIVVIVLLVSFELAFGGFHKIIFRNDLWLFPPEDNLVKLFPSEFFIAFSRKLAINIIVSAITLLLISKIIKKYAKS